MATYVCSITLVSPELNINNRPDGYIYDKEAIIENLLHQKRESQLMTNKYLCTSNLNLSLQLHAS